MIFLVCPHWYLSVIKRRRRFILPSVIPSLLIGAALAATTPYVPLRNLVGKLPPLLQHLLTASLLATGIFFVLLMLSGVVLFLQAGEMTALESTCLAIAILGGLSCFAMKTQFSARYLLTSFPFLLYALQPKMRISSSIAIGCGLPGALLGIAWVFREYGWWG
jgi:hypothetical protein